MINANPQSITDRIYGMATYIDENGIVVAPGKTVAMGGCACCILFCVVGGICLYMRGGKDKDEKGEKGKKGEKSEKDSSE